MKTRSRHIHADLIARAGCVCLIPLAIGAIVDRGALADAPVPPPDYGFHFSIIDHPGNSPISIPGPPGFALQSVGRVDYSYRMATTEVTNSQWVAFLNTYVPLAYPGQAVTDQEITGAFPQFAGFNPQGNAQYTISPSRANRPVNEIGWRYAARFVNWLDNGKRAGAAATLADFQDGAYDTGTFGSAPYPGAPGSTYLTDQQRRSNGALFWIPSFDEWVKAGYWDPNKNGPGQPGYWQYPITSDTAPVPGNPANGGQTNTGPFPAGQIRPLDVGSYADVQSPWGILDLSGGVREYLEDTGVGGYIQYPTGRREAGSSEFDNFSPEVLDLLQYSRGANTSGHPLRGFRIASAIPTPGCATTMLIAVGRFPLRRRRTHERFPPSLSVDLRR